MTNDCEVVVVEAKNINSFHLETQLIHLLVSVIPELYAGTKSIVSGPDPTMVKGPVTPEANVVTINVYRTPASR